MFIKSVSLNMCSTIFDTQVRLINNLNKICSSELFKLQQNFSMQITDGGGVANTRNFMQPHKGYVE